ncbi:MAG: hypothetical protein ACEQSX_04945 [Baekduiaceae bacterium]
MWTPLSGSSLGREIARISPDGTVQEFDSPNMAGAKGIASDGTNLWVTTSTGVARFLPSDPGNAVPTAIAAITQASAITKGPDGNMWTGSDKKLVKFSPGNPAAATNQTIGGVNTSLKGIAVGGDGLLHIAGGNDRTIHHVTTAGVATSTPAGGSVGAVQEVAAGPGTQIAYTDPNDAHNVGRIDNGALLAPTIMPNNGDPFGITLGNDNAYWVARFATKDFARVTTDGQVTTLGGLPAGLTAGPRYITKGTGDTLWAGLELDNKVARITGVEAPAATRTTPTPTQTPTTTPPTAEVALAITKFKVFPSSFKKGTRLPALTQSKLGSQLRFSITKPATVRFRFAKGTVGRKVGSSCVKRTRQNASKKRCVYYTAVPGSFTVKPAAAGDHRVRFQGRITATRSLQPGRYRVTATATGADGKAATPVKATFSIILKLRLAPIAAVLLPSIVIDSM